MRFIIVLLLLGMAVTGVASASIKAQVDRTTIEDGETFNLILQVDDDEPDLDVLKKDFELLGTSRSSRVNIINGNMTSTNEIIVRLAPKNMGVSVIPSIKAGNSATPPIRINVTRPQVSSAAGGDDIFLEAKVDTGFAYVQSQIVYSVRLFRAVEIRDGSLTEPNISDAVVERLGEDITFQATRNQRRYQVTERRFAIFPQQSGTLRIEPTVFQGQVPEARAGNRFNDPFDRFFQSQAMKRVRLRSESLEVQVKPQPDTYTGESWLPAKNLVLEEQWSPENPEFKVGEPVTRTFNLLVTGVTGAQLPEIKMPSVDGVKQYADQAQVQTSQQAGVLLGTRQEKIAIVPTQSGSIELPEVKLTWWDTELDREKTAVIPSRTIQVKPAAGTNNQPATHQAPSQVPVEKVESGKPPQETISDVPREIVIVNAGIWPYMAAVFALGWMATLVAWFLFYKQGKQITMPSLVKTIDNTSLKQAEKQLKNACLANDPKATQQALLRWFSLANPQSKCRNLHEIQKYFNDANISQQIKNLTAELYAPNARGSWNGSHFWEIISPILKKPRKSADKKVKSLPDLYPQHQ